MRSNRNASAHHCVQSLPSLYFVSIDVTTVQISFVGQNYGILCTLFHLLYHRILFLFCQFCYFYRIYLADTLEFTRAHTNQPTNERTHIYIYKTIDCIEWYNNLSQFLSIKCIENEFNIRELKLIYCLRCLVNQLLLRYIIDQVTLISTLFQIAFQNQQQQRAKTNFLLPHVFILPLYLTLADDVSALRLQL